VLISELPRALVLVARTLVIGTDIFRVARCLPASMASLLNAATEPRTWLQVRRVSLQVCVGAGPAFVDLNIAAINPAQSPKPLTAALTHIKTPGIYNRRTFGDLL
jgi:hypothetical protein